jgi:hypothetical protein
MRTKLCSETPVEEACRWEDNIKMYLKEMDMKVLTGFIWHRLGSS